MIYQRITSSVDSVLNKPLLVLMGCFLFAVASIVLSGNLWRLWGLHRDQYQIQQDLLNVQSQIEKIEVKLRSVKDLSYIERLAHDKLDLAGEEDLIFVFSDP